MQGIFSALEPIIERRLNEEKESLYASLGDINFKLQQILDALQDVDERLKKVENTTFALGRACHEAFKQTKDAAECLREELGEASGTLTEATWTV